MMLYSVNSNTTYQVIYKFMYLTYNEKSKTLEKEHHIQHEGWNQRVTTHQSTTIIFSFLFLFMLKLALLKLCQLETLAITNFSILLVWAVLLSFCHILMHTFDSAYGKLSHVIWQ